jgi:alpha-1,2-glucosyltransferase
MQKINVEMRNKIIFVFFLGLAFLIWLMAIYGGDSSYADEKTHSRQINRFLKGNYYLLSDLTTIPGYHLVIASAISGANFFVDLSAMREIRLVSLSISLISIWLIFLIAKQLKIKNPTLRTLQFIFLPISFFYFPFIYTDIFSLTLILASFYFLLKKRYTFSSFFIFLSLLTRQTNIVWATFFWCYAYVSDYGFFFSLNFLKKHLRQTIGYVSMGISFMVFIILNHGIAIGDRINQQVGFHLGNVYFFLAIVGILFLPMSFISFISFFKTYKIKFYRSLILNIIIGGSIVASFIFFTPDLHMYNFKMHFLRNIILQQAYHQYIFLYSLVIFLGYLTIFQLKFEKKALLLFPFTLACVIPSWLIEQRYYIVPLVFMLLFRKETGLKREYALLLYFFVLSTSLMYMLLKFELFF